LKALEESGGAWKSLEELGGAWRSLRSLEELEELEELGRAWRSLEELEEPSPFPHIPISLFSRFRLPSFVHCQLPVTHYHHVPS
jgi:hypothetical protein